MTTNSGNWIRFRRVRNETGRTPGPRTGSEAGAASLTMTVATLAVRPFERDGPEPAGDDHPWSLTARRFVSELFDDWHRVPKGLLQRHEQIAVHIGRRRQRVHQGVGKQAMLAGQVFLGLFLAF